MKIHELVEDNTRSDESLATWLVSTGAKLGGKQAVKAGLKAAPTATKLGSQAVQTAAKSKGVVGVAVEFGQLVSKIVKVFITLGFGYSVAQPIYSYYKNVTKIEDMYKNGEVTQEEYQYQRQQLMGLMITRVAVVLEAAAILGSAAGVLKVFKILIGWVPGLGKVLSSLIGILEGGNAVAAAGAITLINSKWGSEWITKIAFYHLSEIFPSLKGTSWDMDLADVLGAGGTFIVDGVKKISDSVLGTHLQDPADAPIKNQNKPNTPTDPNAAADQAAGDLADKQHKDQQTKSDDKWDQIGPGREQNRRTGVIRMNDKY